MATRTAQKATSSLLAPTYHPASAGGDKVPPGSLLHVRNGGAGSTDLALVTAQVHDGDLAVADRINTVAAGGEGFVRVPRSAVYIGSDDLVDLTWTVTTSVDFAVIE